MPVALVIAHLEMFDRLVAQRTLEDAVGAQLGSGWLEADAAGRISAELEARARGEGRAKDEPRRYASPMELAQRTGFPVKVGDD